VLNARILWAFSAAYNHTREKQYLVIATRAWHFLMNHFLDKQFGGFYWSLGKDGDIADSKKQIYGIAFCLYGFSEYYKATDNPKVLQQAKYCYYCVERYSFDKERGGYLEAFTRNWDAISDLRLSTKDANEKKTMNTHLHVLEAYANLYKVWNDDNLRSSISQLLETFTRYIVNSDSGHLNLFFNEEWQVKGDIVSYGHDIEAAWLLLEAAEIIGDDELVKKIKSISVKMAAAAAKGLDIDGGLWYEVEHGKLVDQKHSWPQAEAMVGFFNAWQLTNDNKYLHYVLNNWQFIHQYIVDKENGEWFWGVNRDHTVMEGKDKAGFWKCPYHNSRACMEISKRISYQIN
jgi:mannobiose 2-epimerase